MAIEHDFVHWGEGAALDVKTLDPTPIARPASNACACLRSTWVTTLPPNVVPFAVLS